MEQKERALLYATLTTAASLIPTAYVTFVSNSIVLMGDFLRCVVEFLAILLSWLVVRKINHGERGFYDFGLGKLEQLASLAIASAMLFTFLVVALSAAHRIFNPLAVENAGAGLVLAALSVGGNAIFWAHYRRLSRRESSPVLESQSKLFRAKAFASVVVCASLLCSLLLPQSQISLLADPIGSILLGIFLLYSAFGMFSASIRDLLDGAVDEAAKLVVLRELVRHEGLYSNFLGIRTRRGGTRMFLEVTLSFDQTLLIGEVARRCDEIAGALRTQFAGSDVTIVPRGE